MSSPVRLRGEVGESAVNKDGFFWSAQKECWRLDRRARPSIAARVDAIVAAFKAALAELQEQSRADRAEVAKLTLQLNEHMDEVASLTGTVEHLRAENERLREAVAKAARTIERRDADLIRYAAAGKHCE